jgi:superoxide dismutase, Fe-Mn family
MDVFEHAYMVDHRAMGRPNFIKAFLKKVNWHIVEKRYFKAMHGHEINRLPLRKVYEPY